ncbi:LOW QUALITY PROTEIN: 3-hydroxyacyl-CoA dehydrogenase [Geomicrobium sp. JCM 19039]|nr:LOW QUALITY PROTEIN: 3-hydroxyacyl-CoA dehydrogenase [Geomicrobium sp. JCM 19039]
MKRDEVKAVVTGGASGLGEATVRQFVRDGAHVAILDVNEERGEKLASELGENVEFYVTDVTDEESVTTAMDQAVRVFGKVNTVVNCAGIGSAEKTTGKRGTHRLESFKKVIEINLVGTFNVIRLAAERMKDNETNEEGERGSIINTASIAAYDGQIGQAAYSASKGGVAGMTLPISRDLASLGIRVVTIAPGLFETPLFESLPEEARKSLEEMTPFPSRLGYPSEYGKLVASIVDNVMLNGETIRLDGAVRMPPK